MRQVLQLLDACARVRAGRTWQGGQLAQAWHRCIDGRVGIGRDIGQRGVGGMAFGGEQRRPMQLTVFGRGRCRPLQQHGVGQTGQFLQTGQRLRRPDGTVDTRRRQTLAKMIERLDQRRIVGAMTLPLLFQHAQRIGQAIERVRRQHRRIHQREQALAQGKQVAGKVAAVHGGDVARR
ncbi:hypothetical protein D3C81_1696930 [compost metagenome]